MTVLFRRAAAAALAAALFLTMVPSVSADGDTFTDVPSDNWAYSYIEKAADDGAVTGTGNGKFAPSNALTYSAWWTILCNSYYKNEMNSCQYTTMGKLATYEDSVGNGSCWNYMYSKAPGASTVQKISGKWYEKYACFAYYKTIAPELGVVENTINRKEMALTIYNVMLLKGCKMPSDEEIWNIRSKIPDWDSIEAMYRIPVATVYAAGIISGTDSKGTFGGDKSLTRAQACVVYCKLTDYINQYGTGDVDVKATLTDMYNYLDERQKIEFNGDYGKTCTGDPTGAWLFYSDPSVYKGSTVYNQGSSFILSQTYYDLYLADGTPATRTNIDEIILDIYADYWDCTSNAFKCGKYKSSDYYTAYTPQEGGSAKDIKSYWNCNTTCCAKWSQYVAARIYGRLATFEVVKYQDGEKIDVSKLAYSVNFESGSHTNFITSNGWSTTDGSSADSTASWSPAIRTSDLANYQPVGFGSSGTTFYQFLPDSWYAGNPQTSDSTLVSRLNTGFSEEKLSSRPDIINLIYAHMQGKMW